MTIADLKTRYASIAAKREQWRVWRDVARQELTSRGLRLVEELPAEIYARLEEQFLGLARESEIEAELDALQREIDSTNVVLELRRMYFLPDPRGAL